MSDTGSRDRVGRPQVRMTNRAGFAIDTGNIYNEAAQAAGVLPVEPEEVA